MPLHQELLKGKEKQAKKDLQKMKEKHEKKNKNIQMKFGPLV